MKMKKFVKGNKYVFSTKKYLQWSRKYLNEVGHYNWFKDINGRTIQFENNCLLEYTAKMGYCAGYTVFKEWCKCIHNSNPQLLERM